MKKKLITLQWFDGKKWVDASKWENETLAWISLGLDREGYRTIDRNGKVLTDKSECTCSSMPSGKMCRSCYVKIFTEVGETD